MKAITLWQPWASLLACGAKQYETRSWETSYRGQIAIHAAAKNPYHAIQDMPEDAIQAMKKTLNITQFFALPSGCIIATAELINCHKITSIRMGIVPVVNSYPIYTDSKEYSFGDFTEGRYAWEFKNMKILENPIPAKGHQRIWNWEGESYDDKENII